jgi:hypothetical protein
MWSFSYNLTADLYCNTSNCYPSVKVGQQVPTSYLHPPGTYNLANPANCNVPEMRQWLASQGVACMEWSWCWDTPFPMNGTNDSTVIAGFKETVLGAANFSGAIGMDECGELPTSLIPGHDRTGTEKMALAAEGFRQAKRERPGLFFAAWNCGARDVFSGLMKDGTFDLAMFEACVSLLGLVLVPVAD